MLPQMIAMLILRNKAGKCKKILGPPPPPSHQSCSNEKLDVVHCGKCRGFFVNFLWPLSLKIQVKSLQQNKKTNVAAFFANLLQKLCQNFGLGDCRHINM